MSYGSGKDRKQKLKRIKEVNKANIKEFLHLVADQFVSDYPKLINDRASDKETDSDKNFLSAVANKNFSEAFNSFHKDVNGMDLQVIISDVMKKQMSIDYKQVAQDMKDFIGTNEAKGVFFEAVRAGIRRILQAPIQSGLSRTVLQKYLQASS